MERLHWIRGFGGGFFVAAIVAACTWQARADDQNLGVARISVVNGTVVLQHADSADKIAAAVNAPVMVGDYVSSGADSRTEVQLDDTNFIRAGAQTQMRFTRLDPSVRTVQLAAGTIELSVLRYPETHPQIQTPSITVRPLDSGGYRVTVTDSGDTLVTVRSGRADLIAPQETQTLGAGTSVLVTGPSSAPRVQTVAVITYDSFDAWNGERDRFIASALAASSSATSAYASSGIIGLPDLNGYGNWSNFPAYGNVWIPYGQVAGWSPYRYGRWAWQPYCGWTWIGYEPWGWAPYHFGRWFFQPNLGWAWYPGPAYNRYYWQPGLVAFFGFGSGGGFNLGNVGWVPLAPFEPYHPWWGRGDAGGPNIVYKNTNITKVYRNAGAPGGIAAVRGNDFTHGSTYQYIPLHKGDIRSVALAKAGLPIAPSTVSYRYTTAPGDTARVAPISVRFGALPQPVLPSALRQARATTQTVAEGLAADHTNPVAHAVQQPATSGGASRVGSADPWGRFSSSNNQTVTVIHTMHGTQIFSGPSGEGKTFSVSSKQSQRATGSNAWSRFDSMSGTKPISRSVPAANAGSVNQWTMPATHAATSGLYAPNDVTISHHAQGMDSNSHGTAPNAPAVHPGAGFAPPHGNGSAAPSGGASGHSGNGQ